MTNPISKVYNKLDESIMYGVNKGVRAWNWTTGKTKSDLANLSFNLGSIVASAGVYSAYPSIFLYFTPTFFGLALATSFRNKHTEELEVSSLEKETLHPEVESLKKEAKTLGTISLFFSQNGLWGHSIFNETDTKIGALTLNAGVSLVGLSFYVMRADSLPPRKSAFSRAKDYLSDKLSSPIAEPIPETVEIKSSNPIAYNPILENYLV